MKYHKFMVSRSASDWFKLDLTKVKRKLPPGKVIWLFCCACNSYHALSRHQISSLKIPIFNPVGTFINFSGKYFITRNCFNCCSKMAEKVFVKKIE